MDLVALSDIFQECKGWKKEVVSGEYVFNYQLKKFPNVIIRVLTGIPDDHTKKRRRSCLKIFAIKQNIFGKIEGGLAKARILTSVNRMDIIKEYKTVREQAIKVWKRSVNI